MNKINMLYGIGLVFLLLSGISATTWIYSNIIALQVADYTLTLQSDYPTNSIIAKNTTVTFTAQLTLGTQPIPDALLYLQYANGTTIDSRRTDALGECVFTIQLSKTGTYQFRAAYEVP